MGGMLTTVKKAATKVVRPRSDQRSRYTDHRQYSHYTIYAQAKIETEDRTLISAITFLATKTIP